ncbi:unnamed protein product [Bursaphelenchus xylophilus]|uniref:(pine wood nematode) hypothetical protein n=1 Tax=Bursaphelenchus xylophilus TaxID=6326 RepID=A0A1I7RX02_BURXY|nr:unnamed protein product [Bursaphelenchus xylophilus]CAG9121238.1 unnamed protein product [Bursaphelenchus xylophilus]
MNAMESVFLAIVAFVALSVQAAPAAPFQPNALKLGGNYDFTRYYFNPQKRDGVQPFNAAQWALPRQLAPKFKRFDTYLPSDKRLDGDSIDQFYMQLGRLRPGRLEWNFNRL